jgi:ubiquinone/menaquinone biosynthesis C-methylase UbiE
MHPLALSQIGDSAETTLYSIFVFMENNQYIIRGGKDGKSRLKILSEALRPYSESLFRKAGLEKGSSFLDVGCGGGDVAVLASALVGNEGSVTAIDFDEAIIDLNRQEALASGAENISFEVMSACEMDYDNEFDIAYSRFLLSHLKDPLDVVKRMLKSVKPGGKIIVEDTHFSGHVCYPPCEAFDRYVEYFKKAAFHNGHNPEIGPSLFSLFQEAGVSRIGFDVILPCFNSGPGKWMGYVTLDRIKETLITKGIADEATINRMLQELEDYTNDERTMMSLPHIFRVWGVKEK